MVLINEHDGSVIAKHVLVSESEAKAISVTREDLADLVSTVGELTLQLKRLGHRLERLAGRFVDEGKS